MAMSKAEMATHRTEYHALVAQSRAAAERGLYPEAVELAMATRTHIDGMMQYERKYEAKEFAGVESIDIVLKLAPVLFDSHSLHALETLLNDCRRIEKNTSESLAEELAKARALMWQSHRLWSYLEEQGNARQDELRQTLGGDQSQWRSLAESWAKMGVVSRTPEAGSYRLALSTRMEEVVAGKCPSCGALTRAPKAAFLEVMACPECGTDVAFVILSASGTPAEG